jgi:hypothetical protein
VDPLTVMAIADLAKMGFQFLFTRMQQAGMTADQIHTAYQAAADGMLARDPNALPDPK